MELYRKKITIAGKSKPKSNQRNLDDLPTYRYDVYLQKSIERQNLGPQNNPINLSCVNESIPNFRSSMQDLFSNEETRKKAIRYVIQARRKSPSPSDNNNTQKVQKSVSPIDGTMTSRQPKMKNLMVNINYSPEIEKKNRGTYKNNIRDQYCYTNANISRNVNRKNISDLNTQNFNTNYAPVNYNTYANSVKRYHNKDNSRFNTSVSNNQRDKMRETDEENNDYNENNNDEINDYNDDNGSRYHKYKKKIKI